MYNHPLYTNVMDYRALSTAANALNSSSIPSYVNLVKPKVGLFSKVTKGLSLSKVGSFLGNAQKVVKIYNQVTPIIKQSKPLINNIRTTWKVAKAFKKINKDQDLEQAFDNLPDFDDKKENNNEVIDVVEHKNDKKIPSPYLSVNN